MTDCLITHTSVCAQAMRINKKWVFADTYRDEKSHQTIVGSALGHAHHKERSRQAEKVPLINYILYSSLNTSRRRGTSMKVSSSGYQRVSPYNLQE
jgi:hypothetical protein